MKGFVVIISGPSGTGKTTLCKRLLQKRKDLRYSISCTTRLPRRGEKDGLDYIFTSREDFKRRVREGKFLEWAEVHDACYGTPREHVERVTREGHNILLAIDVQGGMAVRRNWKDSVLIFVLPPSWRALRGRLMRRRDSRSSIEKRMRRAEDEIRWARRYDYCVVNGRRETATRLIESIVDAERLKTVRQRKRIRSAQPN